MADQPLPESFNTLESAAAALAARREPQQPSSLDEANPLALIDDSSESGAGFDQEEALTATEQDNYPESDQDQEELLDAEADDPDQSDQLGSEFEDDPSKAEPQIYNIEGVGEVSEEDVRLGFMRQDDYQRKTQELADQRKHLGGAEQQLMARLGQIQSANAAEVKRFDAVNWELLAKERPEEFTALRAQRDVAIENYQRGEREIGQAFQETEARHKGAMKSAAVEANRVLSMRIPNWNTGMYYEMIDSAVDHYGFPREEVLQWIDPNVFLVLNDALAYRRGSKVAKQKLRRNQKGPQKVIRTKPQGAGSRSAVRIADMAGKKVAESGRLDDAVGLLQARRKANARRRTPSR
jgi:hypothetical protein